MFGRPHDTDGTDTLDTSALDDFFGDETATANAAELADLHQRVGLVEAQISSQFTSLATYAQIAQEQVEMARAEAKASTERSEQRLTSLIERERSDRIAAISGAGDRATGEPDDVTARLNALEETIAEIRTGLDECLERQKTLADAITATFERLIPTTPRAPLPAPTVSPAAFAPPAAPAETPLADGPIPGLALTD
jgi:hypothetical protein